MKNIEAYNPVEKDDLIDKYRDEIAHLIEENKYTTKEIQEAYYEVLGIGSKEGVSEKLAPLVKKLNEVTDGGMPLNQIVSLIGFTSMWENMVPEYFAFVDSMNVSNNEKSVLKSIVENDRVGEVSVFVEGENLMDLNVIESGSSEAKALQLHRALESIVESIPEDKKYEITFTEK